MTKAPINGIVKSRLGAKIGDRHAAGIYRCFLLDIVETLNRLGEDFIIYYTSDNALSLLTCILGEGKYMSQIGKDLGERLYNGLEKARERGYHYAVALASDVPDITEKYLSETIKALRNHQAVIGPSSDGGFNLIGYELGINDLDFFTGIEWGTENVFEETIRRLEAVDVYVLPVWRDIDELSDLREHKLDQNSHTYRYLMENSLL